MTEKLQCDRVILGGGVIGLAVAARMGDASTILVEAYDGFGRETSSRNSEVIHSGIHYPVDSWKTRLCLEGQTKLYAFCERFGVPYQACGKLILASVNENETDRLEAVAYRANQVGVAFERWTSQQVLAAEPLLKPSSGLFFPRTGIVDSHRFMAALESEAIRRHTLLAYRHRVTRMERSPHGWQLDLETPSGGLSITAATVVNAAGLAAAELSNQALGVSKYEHRFCRGRYFTLSGKYRSAFRHLVYPVPQKDGLGVHTTFDLEGYARLGPDVDWCADSRLERLGSYYQADWEALRAPFAESARRLVASLEDSDLQPGTIGIRPKLFQEGVATPDFLIENHDGWIHCLGIESPGLTASLAIAERVAALA